MEERFLKRLFSLLIPPSRSKNDALAKKLKSAVACPQVVLRQERKEWIMGGGESKTGSFDNSWLESTRVSLWVLS
jgi:hypothetical protein